MRKQFGFSLIQLMIALLIIGIISAVGVPALLKRQPRYEREQFITRLNALVRAGWQRALVTGHVCRIFFDLIERRAWVEEQVEAAKDIQFISITSSVVREVRWPEHIQFRHFLIEGFDELDRYVGGKTGSVYFYLMPGGLAQETTITITDRKDSREGKERRITLILNPFDAQFKVYDEQA